MRMFRFSRKKDRVVPVMTVQRAIPAGVVERQKMLESFQARIFTAETFDELKQLVNEIVTSTDLDNSEKDGLLKAIDRQYGSLKVDGETGR